jgi:hypothetical protein
VGGPVQPLTRPGHGPPLPRRHLAGGARKDGPTGRARLAGGSRDRCAGPDRRSAVQPRSRSRGREQPPIVQRPERTGQGHGAGRGDGAARPRNCVPDGAISGVCDTSSAGIRRSSGSQEAMLPTRSITGWVAARSPHSHTASFAATDRVRLVFCALVRFGHPPGSLPLLNSGRRTDKG